MGQEILKQWQKEIISFLSKESAFKPFYLSGGTALAAYYLKHRISDDLDFFTFLEVDHIVIRELGDKISKFLHADAPRFSRLYDRHQFFYEINGEAVKIEFVKYPFKQLEPSQSLDGIKVDSEYDIAVNKLATLLDRFDPKDFVDLYFLIPKFTLKKLVLGAAKKFGTSVDPIFLGSELMKVRRIEALPKMAKPLHIGELKTFFEDEAKKLKPQILDK